MLELVGLLAALVFGLVAYSFLLGQWVIDDRDQQSLAGGNVGQDEVSREKLGTCCGFGLPPVEQRKPALDRATPTGDSHPDWRESEPSTRGGSNV